MDISFNYIKYVYVYAYVCMCMCEYMNVYIYLPFRSYSIVFIAVFHLVLACSSLAQ